MLETDFDDFAAMLDQTCGLLSRGTYVPDAGNTSLWFRALSAYGLDAVRYALDAHVRDPVRGKFVPVPSDVIAQIERLSVDGRPGVEEAWAMVPQGEDQSVVWTTEMAEAYGVCSGLIAAGDRIAARMAFKEAYERAVTLAKAQGAPVAWIVSQGTDPEQRKRVLTAAVNAGKLTPELAYDECPALPPPASKLALLPPKDTPKTDVAREQLRGVVAVKRADPVDPRGWARALKAREERGERLTMDQARAWRDALAYAPDENKSAAQGAPIIAADLLPPGLRAALEHERALRSQA